MSGQFKGTPGPWEIRMDATMSAAWPVIYLVDEEGVEIDVCELPTTFIGKDGNPAHVFFDDDRSGYERQRDADRTDADAQAIAHVPDMIAALQAVDQMFSLPGKINKNTVRDRVRAALSKALGESS